MTTLYKRHYFDTELLAKWAAFFDLAGWAWTVNTPVIDSWKPDFEVTFGCGHSECLGHHTILISVLPINDLSQVVGHPALSHRYFVECGGKIIANAGALFGNNPSISQWEMCHGAGGGTETVNNWLDNAAELWERASAIPHNGAQI